jgi:uncharacterized protein (DUF2141 family)
VNLSGGAINASDLVVTRNRVGRTVSRPGEGATAYSIFTDVNGDGTINASDLVLVRNQIGRSAPALVSRPLFSASRIGGERSEAEELLA